MIVAACRISLHAVAGRVLELARMLHQLQTVAVAVDRSRQVVRQSGIYAVCPRYDPYGRVLTQEEYDQEGMRRVRRAAVERARDARSWGLVLGTLGRQGNPRILDHLQQLMVAKGLQHSVVGGLLYWSGCLPAEGFIDLSFCLPSIKFGG